jgi:hypothetical protein
MGRSPSHDPHHPVIGRAQGGDKSRADHTGRAGDRDGHGAGILNHA